MTEKDTYNKSLWEGIKKRSDRRTKEGKAYQALLVKIDDIQEIKESR